VFANGFSFLWEKPAEPDVFACEERTFLEQEQEGKGLVLAVRSRAGFKEYSPLKDSWALYRILAETPPTPDGILAFANRYGRLGKGVERKTPWDIATQSQYPWVEPLTHWKWRILALREILRMWDLVTAGDRQALAKHLIWHSASRVLEYRGHSQELLKFSNDWLAGVGPRQKGHPDLFPSFENWIDTFFGPLLVRGLDPLDPTDTIQLGTLWVLRCLAVGVADLVAMQPRWDYTSNRIVLADTPLSLLGAIYLQFILAVNRDTPSRRCESCGRWFEVAPDKSRADRTTCSGTCRTRLHRARRKKARLMRASGSTPRQIATRLETDIEIVKRWIAKRGG
jgi:hypothetical protein